MNGKTEDVKAFNKYLDSIQSRIYEIFQTLVSSGTEFDEECIKARYLGYHMEEKRMLIEVYEAHNLEFKQLVGRGFSYKTLQKYKTIKGYVLEFMDHQYGINDIEIHKIDYQFIKSFEIYLKTVKNCCHNTAMDYLKKIKKILNQCIAKNWIGRSLFIGFKMSVNETHKTFLSEEELKAIASKKISIQRLEQVRDIFLFSCYTVWLIVMLPNSRRKMLLMGSIGTNGSLRAGQRLIRLQKFHYFRFQILLLINIQIIL